MKRYFLMVIILLLLPLLLVTAQEESDDTHPLFEMLALVPNSESTLGNSISYADYAALIESRDYIPRVETGAELLANEQDFRLWLRGMERIRSGYSEFARVTLEMANIPEISGFDLLDMERTLEFGGPPALGRIYGGSFDAAAINTALTTRNYVATELVGIPAWCADERCEDGTMQNIREAERADVFDPILGRKPTVLNLTDMGYLASSTAKSPMTGVAIAVQSTESNPRASVLGLPQYRTAAEVATAPDGLLIQVQFWPGLSLLSAGGRMSTIEFVDLTLFGTRADFESNAMVLPFLIEPVIPAEWLDYGELPTYQLVAFVDRQEGADQVAQLVLIYNSADDAEIAAAELEKRVAAFSQQISGGNDAVPFIDLYLGQAIVESSVYTSETTGQSAAVVSVRYPVSDNESEPITVEMAEEEIPRVAGGLFVRWIQALFRREFYPLWQIDLPEWAFEDAG